MTDEFAMDRRSLIGRIALLVGAGFLPAEALGAAAESKRLLPPASFALLEAVCDTFIPATDTPGAVGAGVPALLDGLLRDWASKDRREALVGALGNIDSGAMQAEGKPFAALSPDSRNTFLKDYDVAALKPVPGKQKQSGLAAMRAEPAVVDPAYARLKELVVALYYSSEVGLTQELVYEHVPGPWVPSLEITPDSRPFGSPGLF